MAIHNNQYLLLDITDARSARARFNFLFFTLFMFFK